jgi:hypothetical protein
MRTKNTGDLDDATNSSEIGAAERQAADGHISHSYVCECEGNDWACAKGQCEGTGSVWRSGVIDDADVHAELGTHQQHQRDDAPLWDDDGRTLVAVHLGNLEVAAAGSRHKTGSVSAEKAREQEKAVSQR